MILPAGCLKGEQTISQGWEPDTHVLSPIEERPVMADHPRRVLLVFGDITSGTA